MKYETYATIMEALTFRENEMLYRAAYPPNRLTTSEERERYVKSIDTVIVSIEAARRELKQDDHWNRYKLATGKRR